MNVAVAFYTMDCSVAIGDTPQGPLSGQQQLRLVLFFPSVLTAIDKRIQCHRDVSIAITSRDVLSFFENRIMFYCIVTLIINYQQIWP